MKELHVPERWYSINGSINSDIYILNEVHGHWEFFYIDERGNQIGHKKFESEDVACDFFLEAIMPNLRYLNKENILNEEKDTEIIAEKVIYL